MKKGKNPFAKVRLQIALSMASAFLCLMLVFFSLNMPRNHLVKSLVYIFAILSLSSIIMVLFFSRRLLSDTEDLYKNQRDFFANASHELKTPVAVIEANLSVLEHDISKNRWIENIKTENLRMERLVKDLLYLAKDDAGSIEYKKENFDLCSSINKAVLPFEAVAFEQDKELFIQVPDCSVMMMGDEEKIRQAVVILIDNAIKNSDPGSKIEVSVEKDGKKVLLVVYNTGHGIHEDDLKKIFRRFYRSQYSRSKYNEGSGLGLSIAKAIVESHHGKIIAESEVNKYARFTVALPL